MVMDVMDKKKEKDEGKRELKGLSGTMNVRYVGTSESEEEDSRDVEREYFDRRKVMFKKE